jgi:hypothetical protein
MFRSMIDMVIGERRHEIIAVVVVVLESKLHAVLMTRCLGRLYEVLWKQLLLIVEVVTGSLAAISI